VGTYAAWFTQANTGGLTRYLEATLQVLLQLPVGPDLRIKLSEELLKHLGEPETSSQEGLSADDVRSIRGWTHFHLAKAYADSEDRDKVLKHVREALQAKVADLTPQTVRDDDTLKQWKDDAEFAKLFAEFEKKSDG